MRVAALPVVHRSGFVQLALVATITSLVLSAMAIGATPVSADHTPDPASVTIAGSLQSELGCPGDWEPACATRT